ncbi:Fur Fe2+/Zn2+ uptake regulation proteins [Rhabdaerophilaceae bacterium]
MNLAILADHRYIPRMGKHNHHHHTCGHDHASALPRLLEEAEARCRERGVRLTEQRRAIFSALAVSGHPLGAYDLIEKLRPEGGRGLAPIAIYRALEFLQHNGLIHRLETLNAYLVCPHQHASGESVAFLICETCHHVEEAFGDEIDLATRSLAEQFGFLTSRQVIELAGQCRACAGGRMPHLESEQA